MSPFEAGCLLIGELVVGCCCIAAVGMALGAATSYVRACLDRRRTYWQRREDADLAGCDCPTCDRWRCEDAWLLPVADEPTGRQ